MRSPRLAVAAATLAGAWLAGATLAGGCGREFHDYPPDVRATSKLVFGADGVARRSIDVDLTFHGINRTAHYALDSARLVVNEGEPTWIVDVVEFAPADWPLEIDDGADAHRRIRVLAHSDEQTTESLIGRTLAIGFKSDRGVVETSTSLSETSTTEACVPIDVEGSLASVGVPVAWTTESPVELAADVVAVASDGADRVWVATSLSTSPTQGVRLLVATPTGFSAATELAATHLDLAPGSIAAPAGGPTAIVANVHPITSAIWALGVTRYDAALVALWKRSIASDGAVTAVATSGGRVLVTVNTSAPIVIDGVEVAGASASPGRAVLLDEATGDFIAAVDVSLYDAVGLTGGAFATIEPVDDVPHAAVREADLALRWRTPTPDDGYVLDVGADGAIWASPTSFGQGSTGEALRFDALGAVDAALLLPLPATTVALGDGSAFIAGWTDIGRIAEGAEPNVRSLQGPTAPWCAQGAAWRFGPTPTGHGFVVASPGGALTVGRMGL